MTKTFHGGSRKNMRKNKKMNRKNFRMRGGAMFTPYADYQNDFSNVLPKDLTDLAKVGPLDAAFAELPAITSSAMSGGGKRKTKRNPPSKKNNRKGGASKKNSRKAPSKKNNRKGGASKKNSRNARVNRLKRNMRGGNAPVEEPTMLIQTEADELNARLNPQWYTENTVIPNFRGPLPIPGGSKVGGRR
jgi:hypothetical protein